MKNMLYEVMSTKEADEVWGLAQDTTRRFCNYRKFNDDEARKSGKTWLVTRRGMERVFGPPRVKKEEGDPTE